MSNESQILDDLLKCTTSDTIAILPKKLCKVHRLFGNFLIYALFFEKNQKKSLEKPENGTTFRIALNLTIIVADVRKKGTCILAGKMPAFPSGRDARAPWVAFPGGRDARAPGVAFQRLRSPLLTLFR